MNEREFYLVSLMEELAETAQAVSKCLKFTEAHRYEEYELCNLEHVIEELAHVDAVRDLLEFDSINSNLYMKSYQDKFCRTLKQLELSKTMGAVTDVKSNPQEEPDTTD